MNAIIKSKSTRLLSALLAVLMIVAMLPTTAFAWSAEEGTKCTSTYGDLYLGSDGDNYYSKTGNTLFYNDDGSFYVSPHNGGVARYKYLMIDANGNYNHVYCIESAVSYNYSDTYTGLNGKNSKYFQNLPMTAQFGIMVTLMYGWHDGLSSPVAGTNVDDYIYATQCILWEYQQQIRTSPTNIASANGVDADLFYATLKNRPAEKCYNWILEQSSKHYVVPSFSSRNQSSAQTYTMLYDAAKDNYSITLTDTNNTLADINFSASGITVTRSGNQYTFTSKNMISNAVMISAQKKTNLGMGKMLIWGCPGKQTMASGAEDPVYFYLKLNTETYGVGHIVKTSEDGKVEGIKFNISGNGVNETVTTGKNGTVDLDLLPGTYTVTEQTDKKVIWKCKLGHEWTASVKSRTLNGTGCPYCSHNAVLPGFNDLATLFPEVAAEWSDRNLPLLPSQVTPFKNKKAWWKCSNGHEWYTLISTRSGGSKCPYCSGIITLKGFNDFKTLYPNLAAEWSDKNGDLKPYQINEKSTKNVWWTCKKCGNVWKGVVKSRVNGRKCPVCSEREVLAGYNDLVTTDPQIVMEWNRTMNAGVAPSRVSRNSLRPVWWKCALGHTWKDRICSRTIDKAPCPTCEAEFRRMLPQLMLLRYSKDNDLTVKLNDTKMVGVEVDAYIPELNTVFTVIDRSTKSTSNIQMVIEHICRRSKIKYVKLDTRKVPEEVCNDIKVAFRAGNIFIRTDSEEDVITARKQFGFWRRKKYMDENSPKP